MLDIEKQWRTCEKNQWKTSKQQKKLFKMHIKTMLYVAKNIGQ